MIMLKTPRIIINHHGSFSCALASTVTPSCRNVPHAYMCFFLLNLDFAPIASTQYIKECTCLMNNIASTTALSAPDIKEDD